MNLQTQRVVITAIVGSILAVIVAIAVGVSFHRRNKRARKFVSLAFTAYNADARSDPQKVRWILRNKRARVVPLGNMGFCAISGKDAYFIFRGTQYLSEWARDLYSTTAPVPFATGVYAHAGFVNYYAKLSARVQEIISSPKFEARNVYVAGHSLGGAIAELCALHIIHHVPRETRTLTVYTFGAPRVGKRGFVRARRDAAKQHDIKFTHFRYANPFDRTTWLPPRQMGFEHAGPPKLCGGCAGKVDIVSAHLCYCGEVIPMGKASSALHGFVTKTAQARKKVGELVSSSRKRLRRAVMV